MLMKGFKSRQVVITENNTLHSLLWGSSTNAKCLKH